jgi:hypothetical protein
MMLFPTQFHSSLRCLALSRFNTLKYSRVRVSNFYKDQKKAKEAQEEARYVGEGAGNSSEEDTNDEILG